MRQWQFTGIELKPREGVPRVGGFMHDLMTGVVCAITSRDPGVSRGERWLALATGKGSEKARGLVDRWLRARTAVPSRVGGLPGAKDSGWLRIEGGGGRVLVTVYADGIGHTLGVSLERIRATGLPITDTTLPGQVVDP